MGSREINCYTVKLNPGPLAQLCPHPATSNAVRLYVEEKKFEIYTIMTRDNCTRNSSCRKKLPWSVVKSLTRQRLVVYSNTKK